MTHQRPCGPGAFFAPRTGRESKTDGKLVSIHIVQLYPKRKPVQPPPDERKFVGERSVGVMVERTGSQATTGLPHRLRDRENGQMGYSGNDASPSEGFGRRVREGRDTNSPNTLPLRRQMASSRWAHALGRAYTAVTWLILPVVICLSQRLSHACLSINSLYCETANGSLNQLEFI